MTGKPLHLFEAVFCFLVTKSAPINHIPKQKSGKIEDRIIPHHSKQPPLYRCRSREVPQLQIGRTNDDTDESHGKASRDIYAAGHESENPGTGFLIEYHCIDDTVARRDLEALSLPDADRIWLLYTILKDADALDRVRFGLRYLDPKYLRNHIAHKLLPVAQLCLGQLTF